MQRTDQYNQSGLFAADRWLQKKQQTQTSDVMIRDVIAVQLQKAKGEFQGLSTSFNYLKSDLKDETDEHLVSRMIMHFHTVCMEARELHLKDNYVNPEMFDATLQAEKNVDSAALEEEKKCKLMPGCENNIMRVSFAEFSFYPFEDKGPLSMEAYQLLISKLSDAAQEYPENMHMLMATLPVNVVGNQVVNLAIYIQCGRTPVLHPFIKSMPSNVDAVYSNTSSRFATAGGLVNVVVDKLNHAQRYIEMIKHVDEPAKMSAAIHNILDICNQNDEYRYVDHHHADLLPSLVELEAACNTILQMIDSGAIDKEMLIKTLLQELYSKIYKYQADIKKMNSQYYLDAIEMIHKRQVTQVLVGGEDKSNITLYPGGLIECVTLGGEKFVTVVDICLDHDIGLGMELLSSYMNTCLSAGQDEITSRVSYVVTSNTVGLVSKNCVSGEVLQCDPYNYGKKDARDAHIDADLKVKASIDSPAFGPKIDLYIYPSRSVPHLSGALNLKRERYNSLIRQKQRLRLLRLQQATNPGLASAIQELDMTIHHLTVLRDLPASILDPENKFDYRAAHPEDSNVLSLKNIRYIQFALENGLNPNSTIGGMPLIHWAIKLEFNMVVFAMLAAHGIDLTLRDHYGDTPLDIIAQGNKSVLCCELYTWTEDQDTRLNFINRTYRSISAEMKIKLLDAAVNLNRLTDVKAMLHCGANPYDTVVYDVDVLESVFKAGDRDMVAAFYAHAKAHDYVKDLIESLEVSTPNDLKMQLLVFLIIDDNHKDMRKLFARKPDVFVSEESFSILFNMLKLFDNDKVLGEVCDYAIASGHRSAVMRELSDTLSQVTFDYLINRIGDKKFREEMSKQHPNLADNNPILKSESPVVILKKRDRLKLDSNRKKVLSSLYRFLSNRIIEEYAPVPSTGEQVRSFNSDDIGANDQKIEMLSVKQSMN